MPGATATSVLVSLSTIRTDGELMNDHVTRVFPSTKDEIVTTRDRNLSESEVYTLLPVKYLTDNTTPSKEIFGHIAEGVKSMEANVLFFTF